MNLKYIAITLLMGLSVNSHAFESGVIPADIIPTDGSVTMDIQVYPVHAKPYTMIIFSADYKICIRNDDKYQAGREIDFAFLIHNPPWGSTQYSHGGNLLPHQVYCDSNHLDQIRFYDPVEYQKNPEYASIVSTIVATMGSRLARKTLPFTVTED